MAPPCIGQRGQELSKSREKALINPIFGISDDVFVVEGAVRETAVEDANETVAEGLQRRVMGVAGGSVGVVEGTGPQ